MARCRGSKADGTPCERIVGASQDYCYAHDPARSEERRRNASKAGSSKPSRELAGIKALLSELTDRVLGGDGAEPLETGRAAVANQLLNTRLRAVEVERKIRETEELERRLEELEAAAEQRGGGRSWGA